MLGPGPATARTVPLPPFTVPPDSVARVAQRLPLLAGGCALSYGTLYTALTASWYTGEKVPLHWFNDLPEWQQLDKCGRFWGAFQESRGAVDLLRWADLSEKQAIWYGSFVGLALQSPVEYFDGRDPQYGASVSDLGANLLGSLGVLGQELVWYDVRLMPRFRSTSPATPGNGPTCWVARWPNACSRTTTARPTGFAPTWGLF